MNRIPILAALSLLLVGCTDQALGNNRVDAADVVTAGEVSKFKHILDPTDPYPKLLRVTFSSQANLASKSNIYLVADFCPLGKNRNIWSLGVFAGDQPLDTVSPELVPTKGGRFVYTAYLVPAFPMQGVRYSTQHDADTRYDLQSAGKDVCLQIENPRLTLLPPFRSTPFVLRSQQINDAFNVWARVRAQDR